MGIGCYGSRRHDERIWGDKCSSDNEDAEGKSRLCFGYNGSSSREAIQKGLRTVFTEEGSKKLLEFIELHFEPGG